MAGCKHVVPRVVIDESHLPSDILGEIRISQEIDASDVEIHCSRFSSGIVSSNLEYTIEVNLWL